MAKRLREEDLRLNIIINGDNGRKEMGELERTIKDTTIKLNALIDKQKKMEAAGKTGSASYKKLTAKIDKYSITITKSKEKLESLIRQQKIETMTLRELRSHIANLNAVMAKTDPRSPQWAQLNAELKKTNGRLSELRMQSKATDSVVGNLASKINRYIGLITAFVASFAFVITGINRARNDFGEYDEALTDAMKTTDLTKGEVKELSESLKEIDTRTLQNELLDLARIGGKLGITDIDTLEEFTRAANVIGVALSEDIGDNADDAIKAVGKLMSIFKIEDQYGMENGMIKTASAINELGMASTANEEYLVSFAKRVAGVAPNANISIQDILGLAGTLDSLGQMSEVSGTAYGQAITGMFQDTKAFAQVAGMTTDAFKDLLDVDANEAFIRVLEGMNGAEGGMYSVIKSLNTLKLTDNVLCRFSEHFRGKRLNYVDNRRYLIVPLKRELQFWKSMRKRTIPLMHNLRGEKRI